MRANCPYCGGAIPVVDGLLSPHRESETWEVCEFVGGFRVEDYSYE